MSFAADEHKMTSEQCLASFRVYEKRLEAEVAAGLLDRSKARQHLETSRKNYKNQNINREIDRIKKGA